MTSAVTAQWLRAAQRPGEAASSSLAWTTLPADASPRGCKSACKGSQQSTVSTLIMGMGCRMALYPACLVLSICFPICHPGVPDLSDQQHRLQSFCSLQS